MRDEREAEIAGFLARAGWRDAGREPLAGDASARRYLRLKRPGSGAGAVLMDAPPDARAATEAFVRIGRHLGAIGLSPPAIFHAEPARGLLLLEDLGDALFTREVARGPSREAEMYLTAADLLIELQGAPLPDGIPALGAAELAAMTSLTWDWYPGADAAHRPAILAGLTALLDEVSSARPVLALRDFHAGNLIWLPRRRGVQRVGLLDFQDAFAGHPAYDLVSLLRDARRDVALPLAARIMRHFIARSGMRAEEFTRAASVLAVQRNLRILGVFCRLARQGGKPAYVDLIPRVWQHLQRDLDHAAFAGLSDRLRASLPPPSPGLLASLRQSCRTARPVS
ncbi:MAG TPA: aminoglycoside phosphotransferase [Aliiroseovarius sp.]|nr:aminoglycoside phosphotransferase [Aliiroseovarius sp.]